LAVGIYGLAAWKHREVAGLEGKIAEYETQQGLIRNTSMETEAASTKLGYLQRIKSSLMAPPWHDVLAMIGQSMPEHVWLDSLKVEQDGTMAITGPGASEDLIYDFVRYLKRVPVLENVNLEGQQPVQLPQGPAIRFDIKCKFNAQQSLAERTARNG
jgi:Tfp pilus assembly protein PilN